MPDKKTKFRQVRMTRDNVVGRPYQHKVSDTVTRVYGRIPVDKAPQRVLVSETTANAERRFRAPKGGGARPTYGPLLKRLVVSSFSLTMARGSRQILFQPRKRTQVLNPEITSMSRELQQSYPRLQAVPRPVQPRLTARPLFRDFCGEDVSLDLDDST